MLRLARRRGGPVRIYGEMVWLLWGAIRSARRSADLPPTLGGRVSATAVPVGVAASRRRRDRPASSALREGLPSDLGNRRNDGRLASREVQMPHPKGGELTEPDPTVGEKEDSRAQSPAATARTGGSSTTVGGAAARRCHAGSAVRPPRSRRDVGVFQAFGPRPGEWRRRDERDIPAASCEGLTADPPSLPRRRPG